MRTGALLANLGLAGGGLGHARRFRRALDRPREAQERLLRGYLERNARTEFGRRHGFASIDSVESYRECVPVTDYDGYAEYVDRIARGEPNVLTREPVEVLEWSSGSTRAAKLIPFTATLRTEFRRAVGAWVHGLFTGRPSLMAGPAYWSVSPAYDPPDVAHAVIPVGPLEDSAYLGGRMSRIVDAALAVPGSVSRIRDADQHRRVTLLHLLAAADLRLISVWHPTFLELLLSGLRSSWSELVGQLASGFDCGVEGTAVPARPNRAAELERVDPSDPAGVWPRLGLVSCWTDGPAAPAAAALRRRLPGVEIQGKGLLATEGVVSIPVGRLHPLAVTSHFLEFVDDDGAARGAWELLEGRSYSVLLTTGGGLYRYALRDRVEVDAFVGATPSIRFIGREDGISDLRGEKLSQGFVQGVLDRLFARYRIGADFAMLAPASPSARRGSDAAPRYVLYLSANAALPAGVPQALERELRENPHYAHCGDLGQLGPAEVVSVESDAGGRYLEHLRASGLRLGDIKPTPLSARTDWADVLSPARGQV